jgi:hypothetical protein
MHQKIRLTHCLDLIVLIGHVQFLKRSTHLEIYLPSEETEPQTEPITKSGSLVTFPSPVGKVGLFPTRMYSTSSVGRFACGTSQVSVWGIWGRLTAVA